jgi:F-type H+-transporting ATPase subunit gamma
MPSLLDIRRRIRAVKSTQQITKAMKMVAASKLRRAQERIQQGRPFATEMLRVLSGLASRVSASAHPLLDERLTPRANGRTLLIIVTADRGLCGSFNTNVIKAASAFIAENAAPIALSLVGRRGRDYFVRRPFEVVHEEINFFGQLRFAHAQAIAGRAMELFTQGDVDRVFIAYNEFKSVLAQRVVVDRLLPIPREDIEAGRAASATGPTVEYLFEPAPEELYKSLIPTHVEVQVFKALLESNAAFYAAQMTAMDAATRNSGEMIEQLTLHMNKVRQAAITREIIEVVSGAQAL